MPSAEQRRRTLDATIAACRTATLHYRAAFKRADELTRALKAEGVCGSCCVGDHAYCRDYGCTCCGAGK